MNAEVLRNQLLLLTRASHVRRYHNKVKLVEDNVGRHSFMVAWLCWELTAGRPSADLLMAALAHDVPEAVVGDVSAPIKRRLPSDVLDRLEASVLERCFLGNFDYAITREERKVLTLADKLEGFLHCCFETDVLGNRALAATRRRYDEYLKALGATETATESVLRRAHELRTAIHTLYQHPEDLEHDCL